MAGNIIRSIGLLTMVLCVGALSGCNCCGNKKITADGVRMNMSPELETIAHSKEQRKNRVSRSLDTDLRQLHDDWDALMFMDQPLRLSKYPIP